MKLKELADRLNKMCEEGKDNFDVYYDNNSILKETDRIGEGENFIVIFEEEGSRK